MMKANPRREEYQGHMRGRGGSISRQQQDAANATTNAMDPPAPPLPPWLQHNDGNGNDRNSSSQGQGDNEEGHQ
jgi:hypothetical protein